LRLALSDRSILCIDWDEKSLRVLEVGASRFGVQIRKSIHVPLGPGVNAHDAASMGEFLRQTLTEHRIRARRAMVDVPRQDVVLNLLSLPAGSMDELAAMVHIQIAKELPFNKEQAVIDFAVSQTRDDNTCDVWVAAVRNERVDHYRQVFNMAGLRLERIGLRPYANLTAVSDGPAKEGRTLLVDIGTHMTEIDVIHDGRLVFSRTAAIAVPKEGLYSARKKDKKEKSRSSEEDNPEAGDKDSTIPLVDDFVTRPGPMETLLLEVSRTIQAYRAIDPGAQIDRLILAGSAGIDDRVIKTFSDRFAVKTVIFEAPDSLRWRKDLAIAPFSAALGLALGQSAEHAKRFNFIQPKEPEAESRERAKRRPMVVAIVALFAVAASVVAYYPISRANAEIDAIKAQIKKENRDEDEREEFLETVQSVKDWRKMSVVWIDQFKQLTEAFPSNKEAYITSLKFQDTGRSQITIELLTVDKKVGTKLAKQINTLKDENGKELFTATPGNTQENSKKDPKYKWKDEIAVKLKSLSPKK